MRKVLSSFFIVVLLGFFTAASTQLSPEILVEPEITPEKTCTGKPVGSSCWMVLANQPKCHVWNPNLQKNETMTWSGECSGGFAQGKGTLIRKYSSGNYEKIEESTGHFQKGKKHGHWVIRYADGKVEEGPFMDDKKHGHWVIRYADGDVEEGPFVDNKKHGHWILRRDGNIEEGRFVDDKKHGTWIIRYVNGSFKKETYVNGEGQ